MSPQLSSSSTSHVDKEAIWSRAVRVETHTKQASHNAVKAEDLSIFIGNRCLLKNADLTLAEQFHTVDVENAATGTKRLQCGTCYGLVGVNGCGKSTLLRLIAERKVPVPQAWDVFIVNQHLPPTSEITAVEEVLSADSKRAQLLSEQASLEEELSSLSPANDDSFEKANARLVALQTELSQWEEAEKEVASILRNLGFRGSDRNGATSSEPGHDTPMQKLSGGWRMKVELAKALWLKPKLLLLDEPTNHLDFHSLQWLSEQLEQYPHTCVVISHDVNLLHGVCREILWLKDLKLDYLPRNVVSQEDLLKMQRSRALNFTFATPEGSDSGNHGLSLHGVEFSYQGGGSKSSSTPQLRVKKEVRFGGSSRAVLVGKIGSGKSTFLDLCAGKIMPTKGTIDYTPDLKIGHFSQFTTEFDNNSKDTAASYLVKHCRDELAGHAGSTRASRLQASLASQSETSAPSAKDDAGGKSASIPEKRLVEVARGVLSNFGFEGDVSVTVPLDCLSGGQKTLLKFAVLSLRPSHILLLDEPSNHLDAEACEALAKGLSEFKGGIVTTTHDELLIYRLINCNWSSSELCICRDGMVWRQQNFAADCLKALTKEVHGAEAGVDNEAADKKAKPSAEPQATGNAKQTVVVSQSDDVPPWMKKKPRARRAQGASEEAQETPAAVEPTSSVKETVVVSQTDEVPPWLQKKKPRAKRAQAADVDDENAPDTTTVANRDEAAESTPAETAKKEEPKPKRGPVKVGSRVNETPATGAKGKAKSKASAKKSSVAQKEEVSQTPVEATESQTQAADSTSDRRTVQQGNWTVPVVMRNTSRNPVAMPSSSSTWEDEVWQLRCLYKDSCELTTDAGGRVLHVTHHCTDPDWEAESWAPDGLQLEIRIGKFYPEPPVQEPTLKVLGPGTLPEKFITVLPLLFAESVSKAPPRTPAVYKALQWIDKQLVLLWRKIEASAVAASPETAGSDDKTGAPSQHRHATSATVTAAVSQKLPTTTVSWSLDDVKRLGEEVRLLGLNLEGFSNFMPSGLNVEVVCSKCRKPSEITSAEETVGSVPHSIDGHCATCKGAFSVRVVPSSCEGGCQAVAHILGVDCHPVHLLRSNFQAQCSECGHAVKIRNVGPGYHRKSNCTGCSTKMNLEVDDVDLLSTNVEKWREVAEQEGERMNARKQLQEAKRMEKGLGVKVGQPLPDKGACKHYKQAFRWLRFPCCGRAFPCDVCHDEQTDHGFQMATRMLCGLCAHEQPFSKDQCTHCGASQNKSKGGYWEGGEGCRDRSKMAKDDPHKYKGLGKTVANKKK